MTQPLQRELATYARERERLEREHRGKFVLIHGDQVVGAFDTFATAAGEGMRLFGDKPFMIRQVGQDAAHLSPAVLYGLMHADSANELHDA